MAKSRDLRALAAQATGALLGPARAPGVAAPPDASASQSDGRTARSEPGQGSSPARHHYAPSHTADRRARHDVYDVDPRRIVEQGPYIREWDEDGPAFQQLTAAVGARRQIDTPIWVRSSGGAGNRQHVLVAGKGRLRAALRHRLPFVPVRDFGTIDDREAVLLQAQENFDRLEMTPAQTAHTFYLMVAHGLTQKEIAGIRRKNPGYVSVMVRIGEALQDLSPSERVALDRPGALQVRQCQLLAASGGQAVIVEGLRQLAAAPIGVSGDDGISDDTTALQTAGREQPRRGAPRGADAQAAPFLGRPIRNGRTFRMRWEARDVQHDPVALADGFVQAFRLEGDALRGALVEAAANEDTSAAAREALAQAHAALARVLDVLPARTDTTGKSRRRS